MLMRQTISHHGFLVGLFDILGFENIFGRIGLDSLLSKYKELIEIVNKSNFVYDFFKNEFNLSGSTYWFADRKIKPIYQIRAAYASDSILLWADRTWPACKNISLKEMKDLRENSATGWLGHPVPCDPFLDLCNELICKSLEIGFPLRGALSIGDAVFDEEQRIFLGKPIIEAARLESCQQWIGASPCNSFLSQIIPKRYLSTFKEHLKPACRETYSFIALDWPRHWKKTRKLPAEELVNAIKADTHSKYYCNTLNFIKNSNANFHKYETEHETDLKNVYPCYANKDLALSVRYIKD